MDKVSKNIYGEYTGQDLAKAITAVGEGMTISDSAREFKVSRKTHSDQVAGPMGGHLREKGRKRAEHP